MGVLPVDPKAAMDQAAGNDLVQRKIELDSLRKRLGDSTTKEQKMRESCEGFESIFIQKMWEQMRKNIGKGGYLHGKDEETYQSMFDVELAKKMSSAGGIGLADMLYDQLSQKLSDTGRTTSPSTHRAAEPMAPLKVPGQQDAVATATESVKMPTLLKVENLYSELPVAGEPQEMLPEVPTHQPPVHAVAMQAAPAQAAEGKNPEAGNGEIARALSEFRASIALADKAVLPGVLQPGAAMAAAGTVATPQLSTTAQAALYGEKTVAPSMAATPDKIAAAAQAAAMSPAQSPVVHAQAGTMNVRSGAMNSQPGGMNAQAGLVNAQAGIMNAQTGATHTQAGAVNSHVGAVSAQAGANIPAGILNAQAAMEQMQGGAAKMQPAPGLVPIKAVPVQISSATTEQASAVASATAMPAPTGVLLTGAGKQGTAGGQLPVDRVPVAPISAEARSGNDVASGAAAARVSELGSVERSRNAALSSSWQGNGPVSAKPKPVSPFGRNKNRSKGKNTGSPEQMNAQAAAPVRAMAPQEAMWPVADAGSKVVTPFGWENDPATGKRRWNAGVGIEAAPGTPVQASMDGTVVFSGSQDGQGNMVVLEHKDGYRSYYGNVGDLSVKEGDAVQRGTSFAKTMDNAASSGNSANSSSLHFELKRGEMALNPESALLRTAQTGKS